MNHESGCRVTASCGLSLLIGVTLAGPGWAHGQVAASTRPSAVTSPASQPAGTAQPLSGPKYGPLRQDDDFSYLDGPPGSYQPDFFDPIKRIHLSDELTLRLGGETRGRVEAVTHKRFGSGEGQFGGGFPTQDTFFLHRYYYHADFQYDKLVRVFFEGVS
ncbi:MAG: hypothetical protein HY718_12280, partial [Planctomycetes bacterium]|nr:hypothetical protein [Planctomycetota bacterium]